MIEGLLIKLLKLSMVVFLVIVLQSCQALASDFNIKFGLIKKDTAGKYYVSEETTTLPLRHKDDNPDFRFGYSVKSQAESSFTSYFVMHFPTMPQQYTGVMKDAAKNTDTKTVQSPVKTSSGSFTYWMRFDRGDPPGQYKIDIWINDKLARTIDFTVNEAK